MDCFHLMQNADLFKYMDMGVMSLEEYTRLFKWLISSYDTSFDGDFKYSFNVILKETGAHIGWVGVGGLDIDHSIKEVFWLIGKEHWSHGYASEAASALLDYVFSVIGLDEVVAISKPENIASKKVIEHIGLNFQKIITESPDAFYNGDHCYSLSRAEWHARQE